MTLLRRLVAHQRWLAAWLIAAALAVRVLVPVGYMPAAAGGMVLTICPDQAMATAVGPMAAMAHHDDAGHGSNHGGHDRADQACPFAGVAAPSTAGAADVVSIAAATPIAASPVGTIADARAPPRRLRSSPPLRGPPSSLG